MIYTSYHFEIYPDAGQIELLWKHFKGVRSTYNHFLSERKEQYRLTGKSDGYNKQAAKMARMKREEPWSFLKEVNSQSLQFSLKCLEAAFNGFFEKRKKYPRYHSCKNKQSFRVPQNFRIQRRKLQLPKFKSSIKVNQHRNIEGKILYCDISYFSGRYYVSLTCEIIQKELPKTGKTVGIDLGIKDFAVTSDGKRYKNHRHTKKHSRKLKRLQQRLSRKKKGSKKREKTKHKVTRIHAKIRNARHDTLHKISHELVMAYDIICIENLNTKNMIKNRRLSKHISDAAWGTFGVLLKYKSVRYGRIVVEINQFFPSSKMCHDCKFVNENLRLSDRKWTCPKCGKVHDRDDNASQNIRSEGLSSLSSGTDEYTSGGKIRPDSGKSRRKGKNLKNASVFL